MKKYLLIAALAAVLAGCAKGSPTGLRPSPCACAAAGAHVTAHTERGEYPHVWQA